ncbi:hypothetical protein HHL19_16330 [Streptomyces sp. R302]|uniref:hypothetical protein n=1 Tax=unclassified Streptomyces TaxID=2593676 RepID=UPI00145DC1A8|nr:MULTISPECIES: hypothetical protein [unclassified Streptomyces]NML55338.1 hypothetical protein [Streptomyces sp. R301]NML80210.1 hypothetical protein [Streptomyces sp. R302]
MIHPGQTYRSADPRDSIRIRIKAYNAGENRALVVDATTGKRPRPMLVTALHATATTKAGKPRRTGYILETAETEAAEEEEALRALHAPQRHWLADHGRSAARAQIPGPRALQNVLKTL